MYCKYIDINDQWICSNCGTKIEKLSDKKPISFCPLSTQTFRQHKINNEKIIANKHLSNNHKQINKKGGPGTELKKLLSIIRIKPSPSCSCNKKAELMDEWGPEVCEKQIDLIVSWLRDEAKIRRLPFVESLAKLLVKRAIKNARKNISSSSRP